MNIKNCTENGEIFSCLSNLGEVANMTSCENLCRTKDLKAFELDDFYNFAERLNESNFYRNREYEETESFNLNTFKIK